MSFTNDNQSVIGIVARNSAEYIEQTFNVLNNGNVVVTLRSADDHERIQMSGATQIIQPENSTGWIQIPKYIKSSLDDIAQLLFTSGTEGTPKGILLAHSALANTTDRLVSVMEATNDIKEYIGVPVYYSFGFARCRMISQVGGACYLPANGFNPTEIAQMLENKEINALSAVPTLLRLILQNRELFNDCGQNLLWMEIGSQYMSQKEKTLLKEIFPNAKIVQHYGLTEASRTTFLKIHENKGLALESVGMCYGGPQYRFDENERIQIRGPHVAKQILRDGKLEDVTDEQGWLTTSDLGYTDGEFLYFDGRADDIINCGGIKISPDMLQQKLLTAIGQKNGIAITKIPDDLRGDGILIAYKKNANLNVDLIKTETNKILKDTGLDLGNVAAFHPFEEFPITETGKLQRKKLSKQYLEERSVLDADSLSTQSTASTGIKDYNIQTTQLVAIWEEVLNIKPVSIHDSFFDLGGDSLSAIRITMKMEAMGIPKSTCQEIFRGKSISELVGSEQAQVTQDHSVISSASESVNIVRGLLVLMVILSHWMPGVMTHLSEQINEINRYFSPFYSAGTPGFAIIFGVSVGFYNLHRYKKYPESLTKMVYTNAMILLAGIISLAVLGVSREAALGHEITPIVVSNQFWSVLVYYLLAILSLPLWLKFLTHYSNVTYTSLFLATIFFAIHILIDDIISPAPSTNPIIQTFILIGTAKYNYFEMSAGALMGVAIGNWYRESITNKENFLVSFNLGVVLIIFSILLSHEMQETAQWLEWPKPVFIWGWFFYLGIIIVSINTFYYAIYNNFTPRAVIPALNIIAIFGMLAFPMFIAHSMVRSLRDILEVFHTPAPLAVSLTIFFAFTLYAINRLYRIYYLKQSS